MAMIDLIGLGLRAAQFLFAIICLGLYSYIARRYNEYSYDGESPSRVNFGIFVSLWTLLALVYLALAPRFFPKMAHKFAILALDAVTMIFWFAAWIASAEWRDSRNYCFDRVCDVMTAAAVFGAFEWILFTATTVLAALHVWRTRGTGSTAPATHTTEADDTKV